MRLDKSDTQKRAKFVISLYVGNPELSIPEVRRLVIARYKKSMNYNLIKKFRDVVEEQRKALAAQAPKPAPVVVAAPTQVAPPPPTPVPAPVVSAPVKPQTSGLPVVTVVSPDGSHPNVELPNEFMDGLKLLQSAIYKTSPGGTVQVIATDGKMDVTYTPEKMAAM